MRFSESHAGIEIQRVVDFAGRFGNGQGSGMGEFVSGADDEGVEGVFRVEVSLFHGFRKAGAGILDGSFHGVRRYIMDVEGQSGHFGNGNFDCQGIFFIQNIDSHDS